MKTLTFSSMTIAALLCGGCEERPVSVCILTARDTVQADEELQRFLASHDDDSLYELSCRGLPEDLRQELLQVPPGGDEDDVPLRRIEGDPSAEYIRVSSQQAEDMLASEIVEYIDVAWGVGISYLERAEDRQTGRESLYYPYRSRALAEIVWAIASWDTTSQEKLWWFLDPSCQGGSVDDCSPRYVAASAYTNVLCINDAVLAQLEPIDCSCRETGCSSALGCPSVELCPEVYPLDPGRTEYSWERLMCTPALRGHIAMPRPDSSGTGLIATYALSSWLKGDATAAVEWLGGFAQQQEVRFTSSGSSPCKMANATSDDEVEGGEDIVLGISYIAALKGIEKRAEEDEAEHLRVRAGTLESGLGYEPEGTAIIFHEVDGGGLRDERRLRRLGASMFVDWVLSAEGREFAARTSSVVVHPVDQVIDTGVCASILDCVAAWARLDYGRIPDDKFQVQSLFAAEVCEAGASWPLCGQ